MYVERYQRNRVQRGHGRNEERGVGFCSGVAGGGSLGFIPPKKKTPIISPALLYYSRKGKGGEPESII